MRLMLPAAVVFLLAAAGCAQPDPLARVRGRVSLEDGTPLPRGMVVFEGAGGGKAVTARGEVQTDGTFQLSTHRPGDGVPPGKYRVLVNPLDLSDVPDEQKTLPFDAKYMKFETSGLEYEVKPGDNQFDIKLAKPAAPAPPPGDAPAAKPNAPRP